LGDKYFYLNGIVNKKTVSMGKQHLS